MDDKRKLHILAILSIVLGIIGLLIAWIPVVNNLSIGFGLIGALLAFACYFLEDKKDRGLYICGMTLGLAATGLALAAQAQLLRY